jgi:ABC-type polysaccharide/polyol phosphate export permease
MHALSILKPFGVDLFCTGKKFLVFNLISKNLKTKYHRSVLGLLWTLLSPLATTLVFYFVFKVVLNVQIPHYLPFILSGMLPWTFFSQTILEGMESLVMSLGLLSKVPIPLQVFPFVGALTNLVTLSLATPVLIGAALLSGVPLSSSLILLPVYYLILFFIAYGISTSLAILFVILRDLRHIMGIALQILFYATPIVYQDSMIPEKYRWVIYTNPVAFAFIDLHAIVGRGEWPVPEHLLVLLTWCLMSLLSATALHKLLGAELVERI